MAPRLKIPEQHRPALEALLSLDEPTFEALVAAFAAEPPTLLPERFAKGVSDRLVKQPDESVENIVEMVVSLGMTLAVADIRPEVLANDVVDAFEADEREQGGADASDRAALLSRLIRLLDQEQSLGTTSKALNILVQNQRSLHQSAIVTDIRPIFLTDPTATPSTAVVIHNLMLKYHENGTIKDFFVTLDNTDLSKLKEVIDRAIEKSHSLTKMLIPNDVVILDSGDS